MKDIGMWIVWSVGLITIIALVVGFSFWAHQKIIDHRIIEVIKWECIK